MSRLYDMRADLAASIINANIGWTAENIIILRQTDLWNDVATAMAGSAHGAVLHIGVVEGSATEESDLEMEVTVPLTIMCLPQVLAGATPEEDLWQALTKHVHDLRLQNDPWYYRFRFKSFSDLEIEADGGAEYLGRQTIFVKHLSFDTVFI